MHAAELAAPGARVVTTEVKLSTVVEMGLVLGEMRAVGTIRRISARCTAIRSFPKFPRTH
jgi:hypothetical protein